MEKSERRTPAEKTIYHVLDDPHMQDVYVDAEEMRERTAPDGSRVPYLYVHGGFTEKKIKFVFCIPQKEQFRGRFFQYLSPFPGPDEEVASLNKTGEDDSILFALVNGAAFVESNMGSEQAFGGAADATLCWKASAAVAEYFRKYVMEKYGSARPYGYVYGGSGGGYKTLACIENTDAWDGACPFVIGSPVSLPNTITMHVQGQRRLRRVFHQIVDALDVGGSGDPYEGLNEDEASMLRELTRMGFPPIMWFVEDYGTVDPGSLPVLTPGMKMMDPTYFDDFWKVPGYLGADPESREAKDRLVFDGVVKSVHAEEQKAETGTETGGNGVDDAFRKQLTGGNGSWIELEEVPEGDDLYLEGVNITMTSGSAAGKTMVLKEIVRKEGEKGGYLTIGSSYGAFSLQDLIGSIQPGDTLHLDNSEYIAAQSYYRHQVPLDTDFHAWDQFRNEDGTPMLPQRESIMGYRFTGTGTVQDGNIQAKVILTQSLYDESTCTWCADWYRAQVMKSRGDDSDFCLQYMDRTMHGDVSWLENNMITNYVGALQQALLSVSDWVERGIAPKLGTAYTMEENIARLPEDPAKRGGLQSVITFRANGEQCVRVRKGEPVTLSVKAVVPDGIGEVSDIRFAAEDLRRFPDRFHTVALDAFPEEIAFEEIEENGMRGARAEWTACYDQPGTHFASVRVRSTRSKDKTSVFAQVRNLARVRIIVE